MALYKILEELNISYDEISHKAVFTVEEAKLVNESIIGIGCKNLFLTDKKKYYLVVLEENKMANIKEIGEFVQSNRLSFASPERLKKVLDLIPGSVTPFGIINDIENKVMLIIDKELQNQRLLFHPNTNTKTMAIDFDDLIKFIEHQGNKYKLF